MKKYFLIILILVSFSGFSASACSFILDPDFEPKTIYLKPIVKTTGLPGDVPAKGLYVSISETDLGGAACGPFSTHINVLWPIVLITGLVIFIRKMNFKTKI